MKQEIVTKNIATKAVFVSSKNEIGKLFYTLMCVWVHMLNSIKLKTFLFTIKFYPFTRKIIYTIHLPSNLVLWTENLRERKRERERERERVAWESHNLRPPKPESGQIALPYSPPCTCKYSISFSSSLFSFLP